MIIAYGIYMVERIDYFNEEAYSNYISELWKALCQLLFLLLLLFGINSC